MNYYIASDLKSFYASVECVSRNLDPLDTNLVVADLSRTEKTICLAVSPSLKSIGIPGRPRLFEVIQTVKTENSRRLRTYRELLRSQGVPDWYKAGFKGESTSLSALSSDPSLSVSYIVAPPQMAYYMQVSTQIYSVYLKYIAPEDIFPYSIDEVFIDITSYLSIYGKTPMELAAVILHDVYSSSGITATAGVGTNMYLAKIAMDIVAKHSRPDKNGARIAYLDEMRYRERLWDHKPLTDFWRVGKASQKKLEEYGIYTMGDIARCSLGKGRPEWSEELLYRIFGVNAELLIDHAWGWEPTTMQDVKAYKPESKSIGSGQVLHCPYDYEKTRLIVREMVDLLSLELVDKGLVTNQLVLTIGYDTENLTDTERRNTYKGQITTDRYGRSIPKHSHGSQNLARYTSSSRLLTAAAMELFERITNQQLLVRRVNITANRVIREEDIQEETTYEQLDLFTDYAALEKKKKQENDELEREKRLQKAVLELKSKYGKNAVLKGMNLQDGATTIGRNKQVGGHKA